MSTIRTASLLSLSLVVSFVLGGCAVADGAEAEANADPSELTLDHGVQTEALLSDIVIVAPECRAVLLSSVAVSNAPVVCPEANPYVGQKRYVGYLESGLNALLDEAQPGQFVCTGTTKASCRLTDRLIERLCTETRTYECPCGVAATKVDGSIVGYCKTTR
jgi:hypothetical protein